MLCLNLMFVSNQIIYMDFVKALKSYLTFKSSLVADN